MNDLEYTVSEIAKKLGISQRAVLYKIKSCELDGVRQGRRWMVRVSANKQPIPDSSAALNEKSNPVSPAQTFESQLDVSKRDTRRKRKDGDLYDFRNLLAYQHLKAWHDNPQIKEVGEHQAYLSRCLEQIAIGFYQWDINEKISIYTKARNIVAGYLNYVVLNPIKDNSLQSRLFESLHYDVIGAMIALTKSLEKKRK